MKNSELLHKQFLAGKNEVKSDLIQLFLALGFSLGAFFCFCFVKEFTPGFLVANIFNLLALLMNTFFKS